jgi:hypothetical protein
MYDYGLDGERHLRGWVVGLLTALAMFALTMFILGAADYMSRKGCEAIEEMSGVEVRYGFTSGCYVRDGDRWVPDEYWRYHGDR